MSVWPRPVGGATAQPAHRSQRRSWTFSDLGVVAQVPGQQQRKVRGQEDEKTGLQTSFYWKRPGSEPGSADLDPAGPGSSRTGGFVWCVCVCVCPEETRLGSGLVHTQFNDTVKNGVGGPGGQPEPEPDGFWMRSYRQHWAAAPARRFTAWFLSE